MKNNAWPTLFVIHLTLAHVRSSFTVEDSIFFAGTLFTDMHSGLENIFSAKEKKRRFGILHSQSFSFYTNDFASIEIPTVSAWQCHIPFRFFWVPGMSICTPSRHERYLIDYMCNWSVLFSLSIDSPKITTATMRWNFLRFVFSSPHAHVVR